MVPDIDDPGTLLGQGVVGVLFLPVLGFFVTLAVGFIRHHLLMIIKTSPPLYYSLNDLHPFRLDQAELRS